MHRLAQRAALMSLLVLALPALWGTTGDVSAPAGATPRPSAAQSQLLREPAPERIGACADGAVDSSEDHDPSCQPLALPSIRISGPWTVAHSCTRRPSDGQRARSQTARGPPLA
jgi:hypothetical protein